MATLRCRAVAADLIDVAFDGQAIELVDRQRDQQLDAIFERDVSLAEGASLLGFRALHRGGIGYAPMGDDRIAGPDRAGFAPPLGRKP